MNTKLEAARPSRIRYWLVALIILAIYVWSFTGIELNGIQPTAGEILSSMLKSFLHPDWSFLMGEEGLLMLLLETLAIAILGTFISAVICVPFAFWAANNMSRLKAVSGLGKVVLSVIRVFPEIIMAILFIKAVGPGAFAGVLALGLHSIGMLGKLFSEAIENLDMGPSEALKACGANRLKTIWFGVIPQVLPHFYSFTLYRFEINVRSASILGLIGAGGIGTPMIFALEARGWSRVSIILIGIIVTVMIVDAISGYIRKRIV